MEDADSEVGIPFDLTFRTRDNIAVCIRSVCSDRRRTSSLERALCSVASVAYGIPHFCGWESANVAALEMCLACVM